MKNVALPVTAAVVDRVRRMRMAQGISAKDFARRMTDAGYRTSRTSIAQGECGYRKEVSVDWVVAAAGALGVPADVIFWGPHCTECYDIPPSGYSCNSCGKGTSL